MSIVKILKQALVVRLCGLLVEFTAQVDAYGAVPQSNDQPTVSPVEKSPQELPQLVAPLALYPDALVAQILAASTYPTRIVDTRAHKAAVTSRQVPHHESPRLENHRFSESYLTIAPNFLGAIRGH